MLFKFCLSFLFLFLFSSNIFASQALVAGFSGDSSLFGYSEKTSEAISDVEFEINYIKDSVDNNFTSFRLSNSRKFLRQGDGSISPFIFGLGMRAFNINDKIGKTQDRQNITFAGLSLGGNVNFILATQLPMVFSLAIDYAPKAFLAKDDFGIESAILGKFNASVYITNVSEIFLQYILVEYSYENKEKKLKGNSQLFGSTFLGVRIYF